MGKASVKVENGKMVNVEVRGDSVRLTGDFFIEPPEARQRIEEKLEEIGDDLSESEIVEKIDQVSAELIGFSPEHVVEAFQEAREE